MKYWHLALAALLAIQAFDADAEEAPVRQYSNKLTILNDPAPLLGDYPEFVQPIEEVTRYEGETLVDDEGADLDVRAWRFSYNARGVIEMPNRLRTIRRR